MKSGETFKIVSNLKKRKEKKKTISDICWSYHDCFFIYGWRCYSFKHAHLWMLCENKVVMKAHQVQTTKPTFWIFCIHGECGTNLFKRSPTNDQAIDNKSRHQLVLKLLFWLSLFIPDYPLLKRQPVGSVTNVYGQLSPTTRQPVTNSWWRHKWKTFSALLAICAGNSPVPGEFPTQRPVTRSFGVFFDLCPNKRLSKQSWGWWFETPSRPFWRHRNVASDWSPNDRELKRCTSGSSGDFAGCNCFFSRKPVTDRLQYMCDGVCVETFEGKCAQILEWSFLHRPLSS